MSAVEELRTEADAIQRAIDSMDAAARELVEKFRREDKERGWPKTQLIAWPGKAYRTEPGEYWGSFGERK